MKKVCKICKRIYEEQNCPNCGSSEHSDSWKGRIVVLNPEGEIAKKLNIKTSGDFAIKI